MPSRALRVTEAGGLSCLNTPLFPRGGKVDRTLRASYEKWNVRVTAENTQLSRVTKDVRKKKNSPLRCSRHRKHVRA